MKNSKFSSLSVLLLIGITLALPLPLLAGDGPIKGWIKERAARKLQEAPAPKANADTASKITEPGDYTFAITHAGLPRLYRVHVPANYSASTPAPALFALHGGGGT